MKINQLLDVGGSSDLGEARSAAQQATMQNLRTAPIPARPNLNVLPGGTTTAQPATTPAPGPTPPTTTPPAATTASARPGVGATLGKFARGVGKAIQTTGDVASQTAGAITQPFGAAVGGLARGYNTARSGGKFLSKQGTAAPAAAPSNAADDTEIADLKSRLERLEQLAGSR